jgi:peptidoglycan/xylan/chitin deacetylase (PgdA/CDA1 family)
MREAGIRFGSHGFTHADLTQLDDEACEEDLRESRLLLETILEEPVPFLAYPRGRHDERVRRAAARAGYTRAFGLPERSEPFGPFSWPRVGVYGTNGVGALRLKTNPRYLPVRARIGSVSSGVPRTTVSLRR